MLVKRSEILRSEGIKRAARAFRVKFMTSFRKMSHASGESSWVYSTRVERNVEMRDECRISFER